MGTVMLQELQVGDWQVAQSVVEWIEIAAIVLIGASVLSAGFFGIRTAVRESPVAAQVTFKNHIAGGLLLGLDLLIAADVIRTVTLEPTLENVAALGLLVIVRTFLSWSLVLETEGRWPWQQAPATSQEPDD